MEAGKDIPYGRRKSWVPSPGKPMRTQATELARAIEHHRILQMEQSRLRTEM